MSSSLDEVKKALKDEADDNRAVASLRFFKTGLGQYGEGDQFIGVSVPIQRRIAKRFQTLPQNDIVSLLQSSVHEYRLTALFILIHQFQLADKLEKQHFFDLYIRNRSRVNNWDLVDSSAPYIVGSYLMDKSRKILYDYAKGSLWERRIAMISTLSFIRNGEFEDALKIATLLLHDSHDLIQKAVGWMLREIGKKDEQLLKFFLDQHYDVMPRTMLRYSIERLDKQSKVRYMTKQHIVNV